MCMRAFLVLTLVFVPSAALAQNGKEKEQKAKFEREWSLLTKGEKWTYEIAMRNLARKQDLSVVYVRFVRDHWALFDGSPAARDGLSDMAKRAGFADFCKNLNIDDKKNPGFVLDWLFDLESSMRCRTAVMVSKAIKEKGIGQIPDAYKKFIRDYPVAFAALRR